MRAKNTSYKILKKELDRVFSLYIRKRDKKCICCGSTKLLQCGHYISRSNNALRYDERNCNCQCMRCNVFLKGNYPVYSLKMIEKYGSDILEKLDRDSKVFTKLSVSGLKQMIVYYKNILKI